MYYLVQSNIYSDPEHDKIFQALEELGLEYESIELTGSVEKVAVKSDRKDVFVYGSVKLARLASANTEWVPGSFYGGNHLFEVYSKHYRDNLLNYPVSVFRFSDTLTWAQNETRFIKPYEDAKIFTGKVFTERKWIDFVEDALENPKTGMLHSESLVQASAPQTIIKEARLWIVGKTVVAGTYYKFNGDIPFEQEVAPEGIEFAKSMIECFNVAGAFVMDICLTYDSWNIVEINCINSAGFYLGLNVKSLVRALEIYFSN